MGKGKGENVREAAAITGFAVPPRSAPAPRGLRGEGAASAPPEPVVATVNDEKIGLKAFQERLAGEMARAKGASIPKGQDMESFKEEVLGRLIEERLMLQRARELGLTVRDEEVTARIEEIKRDYNEAFKGLFGEGGVDFPTWREALRKRMLIEKLIARDVNAKVVVTDEEAENHYRSNRRSYVTERRVRAAQIIIRDREKAEVILKRLKTGEDFGKVAREVSIGPEAVNGGDLGFFEKEVMPEAIDRVVFSLPVGRLSGIVQTPYGYHILKILAKEEAGGRKFDDVKNRVIADLRSMKEAEAYEQWIEALKAKARITISESLPDGSSPTPQDGKTVSPPPRAVKK